MSETRISAVTGRRVWDSRGRPTVEAEVRLTGGAIGRAIAPAGASRGSHEAVDLRDGGALLGGLGVEQAVLNLRSTIGQQLLGLDASDQAGVDAALIALDGTPNKKRLGANALIAVSMAVLHAAAQAAGLPLWRYVSGGKPVRLPLPEIQIFGGGAHAGRRVDIQDFMIMPVGASSFDQALVMTAEVYRAAGQLMAARDRLAGVADEGGWWPMFASNEEALSCLVQAIEAAGYTPGEQVAIALDVAASEFGSAAGYVLGLEHRQLDTDGLIELLLGWIERYPIVAVEDPLAEDDHDGMRRFTAAVGDRVQVIGDDYLVTDARRIAQAAERESCNAALIKPNQVGTITETQAALEAAKAVGWRTIVSARSGESEDVTIVHLATGWDAGQLKVGSIARTERTAKWNEALRIEEALGPAARFAGRSVLSAADRGLV